MPRALLICHADSFIRAADTIAGALEAAGYEADFWLTRFPTATREFDPAREGEHLREIGFARPFVSGELTRLVRDRWAEIASAEALVLALPGGEVREVMHALRAREAELAARGQRPIVASFYNGVAYENWVDGFLSRAGTDVHAMNCARDHERCVRAAAALGVDAANLVTTGLPILDLAAGMKGAGSGRDIVFAGQPTVPRTVGERRYLFGKLADLAVALAEREPAARVIVKPRLRPDQATMHDTEVFDEEVLASVGRDRALPAHLELSYEPMASLIARAGVVVTVSSTAAVEALAAGRRAALVTDFGLPDHYGGEYFLDSGLMTTLDGLIERARAGKLLDVDEAWKQRHVVDDGRACARLVDAIDQRVRIQRDAGAMTPIRPGFGARLASELSRLDPKSARGGGPLDRAIAGVGRAILKIGPVKRLAKRAYLAVRASG